MNLCGTVVIFVNMCKQTSGFIFLTMVLRAAGTVTTNSVIHSKVVYHLLWNIFCADFHFLVVEKSRKINLGKGGTLYLKLAVVFSKLTYMKTITHSSSDVNKTTLIQYWDQIQQGQELDDKVTHIYFGLSVGQGLMSRHSNSIAAV